ncbi:MAG: sigma-70 family RNA polymerase sigma factor [Acidimicrobiia bacterium]
MPSDSDREAFTSFFQEAEPTVRHALVAVWGPDIGREAAADALAYGWEHWERIGKMDSPAGYLFRVGRSQAKRYRRRPVGIDPPDITPPRVEPSLNGALESLTERQRAAVVLLHCYEWTHAEVAAVLRISIPTVQKHAQRGLAKLRHSLEVTADV